MKIKKITITLLGILIIIITFVLLLKSNNQTKTGIPVASNQPPQIISPPVIKESNPFDTQYLIDFNLVSNVNIPSELPVYRINNEKITEEKMKSLAQKLSINSDFTKLTDAVVGDTYIWATTEKYLQITPLVNKFQYTSLVLPSSTSPFPEENQLVNSVINFLKENDLTKTDIHTIEITYVNTKERGYSPASRDTAQFAKIDLVQKVNGYSIVNNLNHHSTIEFLIDRTDNISSFNFQLVNSVVEQIQISQLATLEDLQKNTNSIKVIRTSDAESYIFELPDFDDIVINDIEIGYLHETNDTQTYLQPIFILTGVGTTINGDQLEIVLYAPAIKSALSSN